MIELGNSLRAAREAKGYSINQLSEMTRMAPSTIQDLEAESFSRFAAPIYGRGFVKLYCEAVNLDPKPYIDEFMEIYNGNRQNEIRERPLPSRAEPPSSPLPSQEPIQAHEPEPDLFQNLHSANPSPNALASRYAAPIRPTRSLADQQTIIRLGILALGGILLLALLVWGVRSVYRATTHSSENDTVVETVKSAPEKPNAVRTPQKIPSLYID